MFEELYAKAKDIQNEYCIIHDRIVKNYQRGKAIMFEILLCFEK